MSTEQVKIYIRNSKKYGKILNVPSTIPNSQLYRLAAESQNLAVEDVRLIVGGQPLPFEGGEVTLREKAIVHLINLREVNLEVIEVTLRTLNARNNPIKIETETQITIREFIDDKLFKAYGQKSDVLLLVHIGRQLNLDRTFREQLIENNSQLIVANIQELKNRKIDSSRSIENSEPITVQIKDMEVPEQPKDIYPQPNFTIAVPQEVNASINMDLIFDSKIRHSSSLQKCDLEPEEIIPEEEVVAKISQEAREEDETDKEVAKVESNEERHEEEQAEDVPVGSSPEEVVVTTEVQAEVEEEENGEVAKQSKEQAESEVVLSAQVERPMQPESYEVNASEEPGSEVRDPAADYF